MITNNPARPGDLKTFIVEIDGKDITSAVAAVQVFQDVQTPSWTAQLNLNDTENLLTTLPIKHGSKVSVTVETKNECIGDGKKTWKMVVYRIGDKVFHNYGNQSYTIFTADFSFLKNQVSRVTKIFKKTAASDAIETIISEKIGYQVDSETSEDTYDFLIPNWTPFVAAGWLSKIATKKNSADFFFFQTDDKKFAFKTLETMFSSSDLDCGVTFIQQPAAVTEKTDSDKIPFSKYHFEHWDALSNLASGFFKNKTVTYDILSKEWKTKVFKFGDDNQQDASKKPWDDSLFDGEIEDVNITFSGRHEKLFSGSMSVPDMVEKWEPSRKSSLQKIEQEKLLIQTTGNVASWKWIGKNCLVDLPSQEEMTNDILDKHRKGRYVITAISHMISRDFYMNNFELVKKRLESTK